MSDQRTAIAEALDKLATEGSADGIALRLQADGCTGHRKVGISCPVSRWIAAQTGHIASVGGWYAWPNTPAFEAGIENEDTRVTQPPAVRDFVQRFDQGHYPDLADPNPHPWSAA